MLCFHCKGQGALKKVEEEEEDREEGGGCMGELALLPCERSSIVPGTFQWLPRGLCSYPSPHPIKSLSLIHKKTHKHKHFAHLLMCHTSSSLFVPLSLFHCLFLCLFSVHPTHPPLPPLSPLFFTSRQGTSLLLPTPSCCLFRLIYVIVMLHRQQK